MRKYEIKFLPRFGKSLKMVYDYIFFELHNPMSADKIEAGIKRKCLTLAAFPKVSPVKKRVGGKSLRFVHYQNYTIVYRVDDEKKNVIIYDVIYSRRDIEKMLK